MALINESQHEKNLSSGLSTMQASNQPAQLQRLARMLILCVYSKFINYTFQRLDNKVTDQTVRPRRLVCAFVVEMQLP